MNPACLRVLFIAALMVTALTAVPALAYYVAYDYYCYATDSDGIPVMDDATLNGATFVEGDYIKTGDFTNYGSCSFQADMSRGTVWARAHSHGVQTGPYTFPSGTGRVERCSFSEKLYFRVPAGTYPAGVEVGLAGHANGYLCSDVGAGSQIRVMVSIGAGSYDSTLLEVGVDEAGEVSLDEELLVYNTIVSPGTTLDVETDFVVFCYAGIYNGRTWSADVDPGEGSVIGDGDFNFGSGIRLTEVLTPPGVTWWSDSGVFLSDLSDVPQTPEVAKDLDLQQNHPNPFNPSTTIGFDLAQPGRVTLVIFDSMGRLVRTLLADEPRPAGPGEVVWDGRDLTGRQAATGVYHYRLTAGKASQTRSMVLLK